MHVSSNDFPPSFYAYFFMGQSWDKFENIGKRGDIDDLKKMIQMYEGEEENDKELEFKNLKELSLKQSKLLIANNSNLRKTRDYLSLAD